MTIVGLLAFLTSVGIGFEICIAPYQLIKLGPLVGCGIQLGVLMSIGFWANKWIYW